MSIRTPMNNQRTYILQSAKQDPNIKHVKKRNCTDLIIRIYEIQKKLFQVGRLIYYTNNTAVRINIYIWKRGMQSDNEARKKDNIQHIHPPKERKSKKEKNNHRVTAQRKTMMQEHSIQT